MARFTKIVATLGPASESPEQVDALLAAGVDVFRLNLSHGGLESHLDRLRTVRERAAMAGRMVAVLADLPGPKVRAGAFPDGGAFLMEGTTLRLVAGEGPSSSAVVTVEYPGLVDDVAAGDTIVLGDGAIALAVDVVLADRVEARRRHGRPRCRAGQAFTYRPSGCGSLSPPRRISGWPGA